MILRLQSEQELELLLSRIKAKSSEVKVHLNELRTNTGTNSTVKGAVEAIQHPTDMRLRLADCARAAQDPAPIRLGVGASKTRLRAAHKGPRATFEHQLLARQLTQAQIPFQEEFRFEPKRRWRFDFLVDNFGIEIVGGLWMKRSGHSQGRAQLDDMEKFNHAALLGYRVLQFSPDQVKSGEAIGFIEKCIPQTT